MQICFHVLKDQVKVFIIFGSNHLRQSHYVWVLDLMKKSYLAESSLRICRMLEGIKNLFKSESLSPLFISDLPNYAVGSAAYFFE